MTQKIILGTVQLGLPYGINNIGGRPSNDEAFRILDFAFRNNITLLDTADSYGEALFTIGDYHRTSQNVFNVINKFQTDLTPLPEKLESSLKTLRCSSLYCYMYHRYGDYRSNSVSGVLRKLKKEGKIKRIGISIYTIEELAVVAADPEIDIIQLPINLLDFSQEKASLVLKARKNGKEIHGRSVYLQGLFFMDPDRLTGNMTVLRPYLQDLREISASFGLSLQQIALNYVLDNELVDYAVIGVESQDQLAKNLSLIQPRLSTRLAETLKSINVRESSMLNPATWKL